MNESVEEYIRDSWNRFRTDWDKDKGTCVQCFKLDCECVITEEAPSWFLEELAHAMEEVSVKRGMSDVGTDKLIR